MILKISGVSLYYEVQGMGRPLILLHGNVETHHIFDHMIPLLAPHFTVYSIDTRGHGQSSHTEGLHYLEMAEDIHEFILRLQIEKPILYGFSDGGILGLLLAVKYPELLSELIVSGVNANPNGLKRNFLLLFKVLYGLTRSNRYRLMLTEPFITGKMLRCIQTPTHMTVGSKDLIRRQHTKRIHDNIPDCSLNVFDGETHSSYILKKDLMARYLLDLLTDQKLPSHGGNDGRFTKKYV